MLIPATDRQELKRRTFVGIRCRPEPPAVRLDNRATNRQSHAHALRFGGIERGEYVIDTLRIQPRARISVQRTAMSVDRKIENEGTTI